MILSLSKYSGDVNSCLQLLPTRISCDGRARRGTVLLKEMSWPKDVTFPFGGKISMFIPLTATVLFVSLFGCRVGDEFEM